MDGIFGLTYGLTVLREWPFRRTGGNEGREKGVSPFFLHFERGGE
jgi:hypothetical protein